MSWIRLLAVVLFAGLLVACSGDDDEPVATPVMTPAATSTAPLATPTVTPAATPTPREITGLFVEPRPAPAVQQVSMLAPPPSTLQPHDGRSVTVYDVVENRTVVFEPGLGGSIKGDRIIYATLTGEAWLADLKTGNKTSLGPARMAWFGDAQTAVLYPPVSNERFAQDLQTGVRTRLSDLPAARRQALEEPATDFRAADGSPLIVRDARHDAGSRPDECNRSPLPWRLCDINGREDWSVMDATGRVLYKVRAMFVVQGKPGEILVATSAQCQDAGRSFWCGELFTDINTAKGWEPIPNSTTNIFTIDLSTGTATFIATARYEPDSMNYFMNWSLSADANYIVWTEAYCNFENPGRTRILDRRTGTIRQLDKSFSVRLRAGKLAIGEFGARALADPATLRYTAVLPEVRGDVGWSEDYRYAVVASPLGHGGLC